MMYKEIGFSKLKGSYWIIMLSSYGVAMAFGGWIRMSRIIIVDITFQVPDVASFTK